MKQGLLLFFFFPLFAFAQNSQITLEDIYKKGTFRGEFVPGFAAEDNSSLFDAKDVKDEAGKSLSTESTAHPDKGSSSAGSAQCQTAVFIGKTRYC